MIVTLLSAAVLGGLIGGAELAARYRDKPASAILSPSGLLYVLVNAAASMIALVAVEAGNARFGLPDGTPQVSVHVVQVMSACIGSAALLRTSFTLAQDKGVSLGPILLLHGMLKIVDGALERRRALSRLSHNDLAGLSFARDHAALAELCCHALQRFELAEAQRLGELAADLRDRGDLTDADKLDCFGLELCRLVGERALRKAADRLRDRPQGQENSRDEQPAAGAEQGGERRLAGPARSGPAVVPEPRRYQSSYGDSGDSGEERAGGSPRPGPGVSGRLTRRGFRES